jgi:competence ComEA-like helix-hairpin-helix protein
MKTGRISSMMKAASILVVALLLFGCTSAERFAQHVPDLNDVSYTGTININTARKDELQRIPYVGERLADEIIEYREKHGQFRKTEHLMLLNGISDGRFREIRHLVRVD